MNRSSTAVADKRVEGGLESLSQRRVRAIRVFLRLIGYAAPYKFMVAASTVLIFVDIFFNVAIAWVQEYFIDTINAGNVEYLMRIIRYSAIVSAAVMILTFIGNFMRFYTILLMERDMAVGLFDHLNRLPFGYIQNRHSGDFVSRATSDISQSINVIGGSAYSLLYNIGQCLLAFIYLSRIDLPLALMVVASGPITFGVGRFFDRRIREIGRRIMDMTADVRGILQEIIQGMTVIRSFRMEDLFLERYYSKRRLTNKMLYKNTFLWVLMNQVVSITIQSLMIFSAFMISLSSIRGGISIGSVLAFMILMGRVQSPFASLSTIWGSVQQGIGAAERVFEVIDTNVEGDSNVKDDTNAEDDQQYKSMSRIRRGIRSNGKDREGTSGDAGLLYADESVYALRVMNISFSYATEREYLRDLSAGLLNGAGQHPDSGRDSGTNSDGNVGDATRVYRLSDISFDIAKGETVALVGPSGSGKSTIARICCGLHQPESGSVEVFGHDFSMRDTRARRLIAYVPQIPYLFAGNIRDNIMFGREDATEEEIIEAAKAANAHQFIEKLPMGYDTPVGEQGTTLSGGERQRIALARAFLRDAPLIILDEATSSLDNESERLVQESMERLMQGRTALVIAHRLSTVHNASRIIVLNEGIIAEEGSHEELMANGGIYSRLYNIQFK